MSAHELTKPTDCEMLGGPLSQAITSRTIDIQLIRDGPYGHGKTEFHQLLPATDPPQDRASESALWMPLVARVTSDSDFRSTALNALESELGLARSSAAFLGMWASTRVQPLFIPSANLITLSPRFLVLVNADWEARLSPRFSETRWVGVSWDTWKHMTWTR